MKVRYMLVIALQVFVLLGMIGYRAYWSATGERVVLRSVPVDPRDLFRGDYVRLRYAISRLDCQGLHIHETFERHEPIYVRLRKGPDGIWAAIGAQRTRPDAMPFIQGRVLSDDKVYHYRVTMRDEQGEEHVLAVPWAAQELQGKECTFCLGSDDAVISLRPGRRNESCGSRRSLYGTIKAIHRDSIREIRVEYGIESYFVEEGQGLVLEHARDAYDLKVEVALNPRGKGTITALILGLRRMVE